MRVLVPWGAGFVGRAAERVLERDNSPVVDMTRATTELGTSLRPLRETLSDSIRSWAEHDSIDRRLAGMLAPRPA